MALHEGSQYAYFGLVVGTCAADVSEIMHCLLLYHNTPKIHDSVYFAIVILEFSD